MYRDLSWLGDPIEIQGLTRAFRKWTDRIGFCAIGSVKTNIGHAAHAAGIAGFRKMLTQVASVAPMRRNVTQDDVGNAAAFLCSDLAAGVTGEVLYVDGGYSHVGMSFPE